MSTTATQPESNSAIPSLKRELDFAHIVLAGNPNVGKSVIFNFLTGSSADVSNYPGTTIDISHGHCHDRAISDTPGAYGVSSFNDEERTARSMILEADAVINVVSALSLDRDLFMTLQLVDMQKPMLLVINQFDEAKSRKISINIEKLASILKVPVITTVATTGNGLDKIVSNLNSFSKGATFASIETLLEKALKENPELNNAGLERQEFILLLEEDKETESKYPELAPPKLRVELYKERRKLVNEITNEIVVQHTAGNTISTKLGKLFIHPIWGMVSALLVCYLIFYQLLGVFIAGTVVDVIEKQTLRTYYEPLIKQTGASLFPCTVTVNNQIYDLREPNLKSFKENIPDIRSAEFNFYPDTSLLSIVGNLLFGEYGILTLCVTYLLGLLMPLVIGFYLALSILEDSGYLPRLAVIVDRMMGYLGLNGRAIIPLILGLGCVTMATITTRLLSTRREKIIATALLGIAIPCSAQLGVVSGTLARCGGVFAWAFYLLFVFSTLGLTGFLLNKVMPGKSANLLIDLPPMRMPRISNVVSKTWKKSYAFLLDAAPMFALASIVVTVFQMAGLLTSFIDLLKPITVSWLQLPNDPRIATTFILGIVRRDFAAFGLTDIDLTTAQAITAVIVITLFVPCIATVGVMIKERGLKIASTIWFGSWLFAFLAGGLIARLLAPLCAYFHL